MKKIISLFLVIALTAIFAVSCNGNDQPETTSTNPIVTPTDKTTTTAATPVETKATTNIFTPIETTGNTEPRVVAQYKKVSLGNFEGKILIDNNNEEYGITITKWLLSSEELDIPSTLIYEGKEYPVIQIGTRSNGAIAGQNFTSLKISSNVKLISENAFMSSSQLETVEIEEGLEEIASFAFWNSGVVSINLPSTLKTIGDYAFSSCVNLESLVIPSSVTEIGEQAFVGCSGLRKVTLPRAFEAREDELFNGCYSVEITYAD